MNRKAIAPFSTGILPVLGRRDTPARNIRPELRRENRSIDIVIETVHESVWETAP